MNFVNPRDMAQFIQRTLWDSDLGGQKFTTRSTAGLITWVVGNKTKVLIGAGSKLQGETEISTPAAETVAGAIAVTKSGFPINSVFGTNLQSVGSARIGNRQ